MFKILGSTVGIIFLIGLVVVLLLVVDAHERAQQLRLGGERDGLWPVTAGEFEQHRRSLYLLNKRTVRLPMMTAFDQPDTMTSCPMRPVSTHALQALSLFNSNFMREESNRFAARLGRECGNDHAFQLRRAYKLALARPPKPVEMKMGEQFLAGGGTLADFCLALFNRNEFVYVP